MHRRSLCQADRIDKNFILRLIHHSFYFRLEGHLVHLAACRQRKQRPDEKFFGYLEVSQTVFAEDSQGFLPGALRTGQFVAAAITAIRTLGRRYGKLPAHQYIDFDIGLLDPDLA